MLIKVNLKQGKKMKNAKFVYFFCIFLIGVSFACSGDSRTKIPKTKPGMEEMSASTAEVVVTNTDGSETLCQAFAFAKDEFLWDANCKSKNCTQLREYRFATTLTCVSEAASVELYLPYGQNGNKKTYHAEIVAKSSGSDNFAILKANLDISIPLVSLSPKY